MAFEELINAAATKYKLDPHLLAAIMAQESGGNPQAKSPKGASGLMQLMPETAKNLGVTDVFDPAQNVDAGARYFQQMLDRFGGDTRKALAAYNAGPEKVEQYGDVPPYPETQGYVKNILERSGDKSQKGTAIYEATGPDGNKLRIEVPRGSDQKTIKSQFEAEFNRRKKGEEQRKQTVQPMKGFDPYQFGRETVSELPGAVGRAMKETGKEWMGGGLAGFGGSEDLSQPGALERGMSPESIPVVGSLIRLTRGEFSPSEAADWAIGMGRAGIGGGASKALGVRDIEQIPNAMKRAVTEPGYSKGGASVGAAAGGGVGAEAARVFGLPYQAGLYPGMAAGGAVGSKVPAMTRGFLRGLKEPYTLPGPSPEVVEAEYAPSATAARRMQPRLQNTVDIRTEPGAQPMPPVTPNLRQMPPPSPQQSLPAGPARVFQMPSAKFTNPYQRGPVSPETGMSVSRQSNLPLYQPGANIPPSPEGAYQGVQPTPESVGKQLVPNIRRESIGRVGEERQPQPTVKQLEKAEEKPKPAEVKSITEGTKKVVLPSTVKEHARIHGQSVEEAEKYYRDQGYEIRKRSLKKKD